MYRCVILSNSEWFENHIKKSSLWEVKSSAHIKFKPTLKTSCFTRNIIRYFIIIKYTIRRVY